jgi:hypothetical protein
MPRYLTGNTGGAAAQAIASTLTTFVAGEAVRAGDPLALGTDGLVYAGLEPGVPGSTLKPLSNPSPVFNTLQIPMVTASTLVPAVGNSLSVDKLVNGNLVFVWRTDPSLYYAIYKPDGSVVVPPTILDGVGTSAVNRLLKVKALTGGGFAVGWSILNGAIQTPRFALFDANGLQQGAIINVENPATSFPTVAIEIAQLASGDIVYAYGAHNGTNYQPRFSIFSAAGAIKIANVQVDTTMTAAITLQSVALYGNMAVVALSGGTFVYGFGLYDGTNTRCYFRRYDATGSPLAARASPTANYSAGNSAPLVMCATTDGGFVVSVSNSIGKFDATGATINSANVGLTYGHSLTPLPGGGFRVAVSATTLNVWVFNAAGAQVGTTLSFDTSTTTSNPVTETTLSDGSILFCYNKSATAVYTRVDANLNVIGTAGATVGATLPGAMVFGFATLNGYSAAPTFAVAYCGSAGVQVGLFFGFLQKLTFIGVATASAAQGSAVPTQYTGVATLRLGFKQPLAVNYQASSPPGQKASIVGNSAILLGVQ